MPTGFFDIDEAAVIRGDEAPVRKPSAAVANCSTCGLHRLCLTPKMEPTGKGKKKILVLAEAPGKEEDIQGIQLIGESGQLLREIMAELDIDLDRDCWKTKALCCRPPENASPEPLQIAACRHRLMNNLQELQPRAIIALGKFAMDSLVGDRLTGRSGKLTMTDWQGAIIPDQDLKTFILPTWHPAYLLRQKNDKVIRQQIKDTIRGALIISGYEFPCFDYKDKCHVITDVEQAIYVLQKIRAERLSPVAFDYETTGLKSQRQGHKIFSASISTGMLSWSFPFFDNEEFRQEWKRILMSPKIEKTCHNAKFEANWTRNILGYWPENVTWDTMLAAKCIRNKKKTNLKFQTYIHFGIIGYDDRVDGYLSSLKQEEKLHGTNSFNMIQSAPLQELLFYNAADSLFTSWLRAEQEKVISDHQQKGLLFFMDSIFHLAKAEYNGIRLEEQAAEQTKKEITEVMNNLEESFRTSPEMKKWDKEESFRPSAPADLAHLVFDIMKYEPENYTETGKPQANREAMDKIPLQIVKDVMGWRKWQKARDTYVADYIREAVNGYIHPVFNLHIADTYRSSADSPNFQNIPKRDKEVARKIRSLLFPHPGHRLVEYDYKAVEVCLDGDTLIETIDGKRKLKEITLNFKKENIYVYCYDLDKKRVAISKVINGGLTQKNAECIKVTLDNNESIIVTPNHKFLMRNGEYKEAQFLKENDSVMPFYSKMKRATSGVNYLEINLNNGSRMFAHNLIAEDVIGIPVKGTGLVVHHKDSNGMNNSLDNLDVISRKDHMRIHAIQSWDSPKKKRTFKTQKSKEHLAKMQQKHKEWRESLSDEEKQILVERQKKSRRSYVGENNPNYGKTHSVNTKQKISKTKKEQKLIGEKSHNFGKPLTDEVKLKLSISHRVENLSAETRKRISDAQKGKKLSDETKQKLSIAGRGRVFSEETRKKLSDNKKKYWENIKKERNHKIISVTKVTSRDVYCITVENTHNFAVSAGVIVKNCVSACYNKDPNLIKYVTDPSTDMHRDMAMQLFIRDKIEDKAERQVAKNGFVFPEFYGSYYEQVAPAIWGDISQDTKRHLKDQGIRNLKDFIAHVQDIETDFWENRFGVYAEWKKKIWKDYQKKGYVELYTGFRCYGPMNEREVSNYPVQGSAFHCLLWTFSRVSEEIEQREMVSRMIGQIHDAAVVSVHPDEEAEMDRLMKLYGTQKIREHWDWIIVPLNIEKSRSATDGSWADMEDCGLL